MDIIQRTRSVRLSLNRPLNSMKLRITLETDPDRIDTDAQYDPTKTFDFYLCLWKEQHVVSSISCNRSGFNTEELEIYSKTVPQEEGQKYNLLLRTGLVQMMRPLRVRRIISRAIHSGSIYVLSKYFHAHNASLDEWMRKRDVRELTPALAKEFYDERVSAELEGLKETWSEEEVKEYFFSHPEIGEPVVMSLDFA